jgi:hypothetical protein
MTHNNHGAISSHQPQSRRTRRALRAGAVLGVLVIALSVAGCATPVAPIAKPTPSASPTPSPTPTPTATPTPVPIYTMSERPGYAEAEAFVTEMYNKYTDKSSPEYAYALVPQTPGGQDYAQAFAYLLADKKVIFLWNPGTTSEDAAELDAQIKAYVDEATELERKFRAGEPLGISVSITRGDGSVFTSDGTDTPND